MYCLLFPLAMPFFAARLLLPPLAPKHLSSEIDNEETSWAITRPCPVRSHLAAGTTQTYPIADPASILAGHGFRLLRCGLLPQ